MASKSVTVDVDVKLDDFLDDDLIDELESRGFKVEVDTGIVDVQDIRLTDAAWRLQRGEIEETLEIIARVLGTEFRDLPDAARKRMQS